jgi:phage shock protein A
MWLWDIPSRLWLIARTAEELLALQKKTREGLEAIDTRLRALEDRMTHLEAEQGQLVASAKAAASVTAAGVAGSVISDVVTRVTRIEMRQEDLKARLPPP